MIDSAVDESSSIDYKNACEPDLAIVPKFSTISSLFIPIPLSKKVMVLSLELVVIVINRFGSPLTLSPFKTLNLYFSKASELFDSNSLMNTSLSV